MVDIDFQMIDVDWESATQGRQYQASVDELEAAGRSESSAMTPEQADASVPQSYGLATDVGICSSGRGTQAAGLKPTDEQLEAWAVCNTTEKTFEGLTQHEQI